MRTTRRTTFVTAATTLTMGATMAVAVPADARAEPSAPPAMPSWVRTAGEVEADTGYSASQTDWARRDTSTSVSPDALLRTAGVSDVVRGRNIDGVVAVRDVGGAPKLQTVHATNPAALRRAVRRLQADPSVVSLSVNRRSEVMDSGAAAPSCQVTPAGTAQWDYSALGVGKLAAQGVTGAGATVAVIDSGVNGKTPGLRGKVLQGTDLVGVGNGWNDAVGHGTHVAGTIAADGGGLRGMAPGARILPVRVADSAGFAYDSDTAAGIQYAVKHGAGILNLSLAGDYSPAVATMIKYALSRDVLVSAAAGNEGEGDNPVLYPAAYSGVLAVAATQRDRSRAAFSESHSYVRIAAPGSEIVSTFPVSPSAPAGRCVMQGTSMASPHVAGAAALLYQAGRHRLTGSKAVTVLLGTTTDAMSPGYDINTGYGIVDPVAAVARARCYAAGTCSLPLANVRASQTQRWVQRASVTLSGHGPGAATLLGWSGSRPKPAIDLTYPLTASAYYNRRAVQQYLYSAARRTGPEASVAFYANKLARGMTQQQLYATLLATNEAYRRAGSTDSRWVSMAYREATGHQPSAAVRAHYVDRLTHGATRQGIARILVNSPSGLSRIVDAQYQRFLGHLPNPQARASWAKRLRAGASVRSLSARLVAGAEYRSGS